MEMIWSKLYRSNQPDFIVPEIEAIRTEKLIEFEQRGIWNRILDIW